jgi:nucleoside-diphosphate-sugar epimerase
MIEKRVLLTGHLGYIGSVMAPMLVEAGYDVVGLDSGLFADCTLVPDVARIPEIPRDLRDVRPGDLDGFDAVVHLGALSNDPIGNLDESWTRDINDLASVRLAQLARDAGVERFLFSSSCIMYGMSEVADVDETSPLAPQTEYARSKARSEEAIKALATDQFSPVFLRNGTIYGISPRMRFDTVLNNLVASAATTGRVVVQGDGSPWRPVVHVEDVARAFIHVLEAPRGPSTRRPSTRGRTTSTTE